jgi:hypothetical protein
MIKILFVVIFSFGFFSCNVEGRRRIREYNPEYCVNTCIKALIANMDDSSFSQNNFSNFNQIVNYCKSKKRYKCESKSGRYDYAYGFNFEKMSKYNSKFK